MMTNASSSKRGFIERVEGRDNGQLAMLRRGCGKRDPVEGRCPWLIGLIHGVASEPVAFLVASLLAQYKTVDIRNGHHRFDGNFGATWRNAISGEDSESLQRRFHILLDADYDPWTGDGDLPHRLRQMVRYSASKGIGVDWLTLLTDLRFWNHPGKHAQKRWARSFFIGEQPVEKTHQFEEEE